MKNISIRGVKTEPVKEKESGSALEIKETYKLGRQTRGMEQKHSVILDKDNVIGLEFEDQTQWLCSPETLNEVFPEAGFKNRESGGEFEIPGSLSATDERGGFTGVLLSGINIFKKSKILKKGVREFAAEYERKKLEERSGLYSFDRKQNLLKLEKMKSGNKHLLFLHGTSSSTLGSFGKLSNNFWDNAVSSYGNNIIAFEHETLTKSPLENVLDLIGMLPSEATIDLTSHSRGGLVGDILSRFCSKEYLRSGFTDIEIESLNKANRQFDIEIINKIRQIIDTKDIKINKFIRVACPACGTTLASKRLDNFFNITRNLIGFATGQEANPVYIAFTNLLSAVLDSRNDISVLPGIEAMNPESPLIKVINSVFAERNSLRVCNEDSLFILSGNCNIKLNFKALLILVSRLFYAKDNDLVVNTKSMYLGTKRKNTAQYFFDENSDVDHFNYFENASTNEAIIAAMKVSGEEKAEGFKMLTPENLAGTQRGLLQYGEYTGVKVTGNKPIVILLPGIMGSNIFNGNDKVWINYAGFIAGKLDDIRIDKTNISVRSLVGTSYRKLGEHLEQEYDVAAFPYDWRDQMSKSANLLNDKIIELMKFNKPVKVVAHSMGGVLFREFIMNHPDTWMKLNESKGFKLVLLGVPMGGSFDIPSVICGEFTLIKVLSLLDISNDKEDLMRLFSRFPGVLNLLPLTTDKENDFSNPGLWKEMFNAAGNSDKGLPDENDLIEFKKYRDRVIKEYEQIDFSNAVYIAGKANATLKGYEIREDNGSKELVFLATEEGDARVTWESGIPKQMIGKQPVYYVDVKHGELANTSSMFRGISELLRAGETNLFSDTKRSYRGDRKQFTVPEDFNFDLSQRGVENAILGNMPEDEETPTIGEIKMTVTTGDLKYASHMLLAGHFLNDGILYAENSLDQYLGGELKLRHGLNLYPGEIGTSKIFPPVKSGFKGAIILGLGKPGNLTAYRLARTVETGTCDYLLRLNSKRNSNRSASELESSKGLSSLLIGCGYGGLTIESSAVAIIQGINNANIQISKLFKESPVFIERIEFIELYEDKALNCFYSLKKLLAEPIGYNVSIAGKSIKEVPGYMQRLPVDSTSEWWTRINIKVHEEDIKIPFNQRFVFNVSTGGAREEKSVLSKTDNIINGLLEEVSSNDNWSPQLAKTIFELLIPNDFKELLKRQGNIVLILDKQTAAVPWEMLQDESSGAKPLSVSAGMIRQLSTSDSKKNIRNVLTTDALVVSDPELDGYESYSQLPGAEAEGKLVNKLLKENGYKVNSLVRRNRSPEIIQALFSKEYKIIHLAGHGEFKPETPEDSGMIIGNKIFLTTKEINQMSSAPELVFINCCHLGKTDGVSEKRFRDSFRLAANIGTQLIENGVKAVIAAGWAVNDDAALEFTNEFYRRMFEGCTFGEAILQARKLIWKKFPRSNTWGAYQCYGDPFYKFRETESRSRKNNKSFIIAKEAEIELSNLLGELKKGDYDEENIRLRIENIRSETDKAELNNAVISEMEAILYYKLYDYDKALEIFESLLEFEDASFSFSAMETFANIKAKKCIMELRSDNPDKKQLLERIENLISEFERLLELGKTSTRLSLLASAHAKKSLLLQNTKDKLESIKDSTYYYKSSYDMQTKEWSTYTIINWINFEAVLSILGERIWGKTITHRGESYKTPEREEIINILDEMIIKNKDYNLKQENYWTYVNNANIKLCRLLLDFEKKSLKDLQGGLRNEVMSAYEEVWNVIGSKSEKMTELEYHDLLIDTLSISEEDTVKKRKIKDKEKVIALLNIIKDVREEFNKMMERKK